MRHAILKSMKLRWLIVVLLGSWMVSGGAHAAPACSYFSPAAVNRQVNFSPNDPVLWLAGDKSYFTATWFCDRKYFWQQNFMFGYRNELVPDFQSVVPTLAKMDLATFQAYVAAHIDPASDLELLPLAQAQIEATKPPNIVWVVKDNPQSTTTPKTRPTFPLKSDGTRDIKSAPDRIAVGSPCSCQTAVVEEPISGTDSVNAYCLVTGTDPTTQKPIPPSRLSLCVRP